MRDIIQQIQQTKAASSQIAKLSSKDKKQMLLTLVDCLQQHEKDILEANRRDIIVAKKRGYSSAFLDRLTLSEKNFIGMVKQLKTVASFTDPVGEVIEQRILNNGIHLHMRSIRACSSDSSRAHAPDW